MTDDDRAMDSDFFRNLYTRQDHLNPEEEEKLSRFTEFMKMTFSTPRPEYNTVPPLDGAELEPGDALWIEGYAHGATVGYENALSDVEYLVKTLEKEVKPTKVEIEFNRPLTYAEREAFRDQLEAGESDTTHRFVGDKNHAKRVVLESSVESRQLVDDVSEFVSSEFLNVYPRTAKTVRPKVRV